MLSLSNKTSLAKQLLNENTVKISENTVYFPRRNLENAFMKHVHILLILLSLSACGKRCELTPFGEENPSYPRQYPQAETQA
jgi:hypothetical protein